MTNSCYTMHPIDNIMCYYFWCVYHVKLPWIGDFGKTLVFIVFLTLPHFSGLILFCILETDMCIFIILTLYSCLVCTYYTDLTRSYGICTFFLFSFLFLSIFRFGSLIILLLAAPDYWLSYLLVGYVRWHNYLRNWVRHIKIGFPNKNNINRTRSISKVLNHIENP